MRAQKNNMLKRIKDFALGSLIACSVCSSLAYADARPRIGLVLGGGGARGAAHIGVLEVLREQRVQIDCVAGTSMGGLVSGAFAAGLTPDEMLQAMDEADWRDMFMDSPAASDINARNRNLSRRFLPGSEIGITPNGAVPLPGVVSGQKIKLFFNKLVRSEYGEPQIENLKMPLSSDCHRPGEWRQGCFPERQPDQGDAGKYVGARTDVASRGWRHAAGRRWLGEQRADR